MQSETESGRKLGPMMTSFNHRKETRVKWFGHVQDQQGLPRQKAILQGTVQGGRRRGCQKNCWENNIFEWTGLKFCDALRK